MHGNYQNRQNRFRDEMNKASVTSVEEQTLAEPVITEVEAPVIIETKAAEPEPTKKSEIIGVVIDCTKLNVRERPSSDANVVATISVGSEVMVDTRKSTSAFYKVCNAAGIEGFCMKKYVEIHQ